MHESVWMKILKVFLLVVIAGGLTMAGVSIYRMIADVPDIQKIETMNLDGLVIIEEYTAKSSYGWYRVLMHKESRTLYLDSKNSGLVQMIGPDGLPLLGPR